MRNPIMWKQFVTLNPGEHATIDIIEFSDTTTLKQNFTTALVELLHRQLAAIQILWKQFRVQTIIVGTGGLVAATVLSVFLAMANNEQPTSNQHPQLVASAIWVPDETNQCSDYSLHMSERTSPNVVENKTKAIESKVNGSLDGLSPALIRLAKKESKLRSKFTKLDKTIETMFSDLTGSRAKSQKMWRNLKRKVKQREKLRTRIQKLQNRQTRLARHA